MSAEHTSLAFKILQARAGGRVERCHAIPHVGSYSDAAHSWGVAVLMLQLWPEDFPRLAAACLVHDVPEYITGDIIATMMRYSPGLKETVTLVENKLMDEIGLPQFNNLSVDDHAKLKACDWLEFWLWCCDQATLGNTFALEGKTEIEEYMDRMGLPEPANQVYSALKSRIRSSGTVASQASVLKRLFEGMKNEQGQ